MTSQAKTDVELSLAADEFIWAGDGLGNAHQYILPTVIDWLSSANARTVLDLGCGNGAVTRELARNGFQAIGTDASWSGISIASGNSNIEFLQADIETPLPAHLHSRFDAVIAIEVIEHLLRPRFLFERAREALKPNGTLIISTPFHGYLKNIALALCNRFDEHWHPLRDFGHVKFFSRSTLTQLFHEQRFAVEAVARVGRIAPLAKSMVVHGRLAPEVNSTP